MTNDAKESMLRWVAVGVLVAYALMILLMLGWVLWIGGDSQWDRAIYLLTGVEAIVFVAVGFLFGAEVNRKRAETADERALNAEQRALNAEGRALDAEGRAANAEVVARFAQDELASVRRTENASGSTAPGSASAPPGAGRINASAVKRPLTTDEGEYAAVSAQHQWQPD